jgi:hypothetical protein
MDRATVLAPVEPADRHNEHWFDLEWTRKLAQDAYDAGHVVSPVPLLAACDEVKRLRAEIAVLTIA